MNSPLSFVSGESSWPFSSTLLRHVTSGHLSNWAQKTSAHLRNSVSMSVINSTEMQILFLKACRIMFNPEIRPIILTLPSLNIITILPHILSWHHWQWWLKFGAGVFLVNQPMHLHTRFIYWISLNIKLSFIRVTEF